MELGSWLRPLETSFSLSKYPVEYLKLFRLQDSFLLCNSILPIAGCGILLVQTSEMHLQGCSFWRIQGSLSPGLPQLLKAPAFLGLWLKVSYSVTSSPASLLTTLRLLPPF